MHVRHHRLRVVTYINWCGDGAYQNYGEKIHIHHQVVGQCNGAHGVGTSTFFAERVGDFFQ